MTLCAGAFNQFGLIFLYIMMKFNLTEYMVYNTLPFIIWHSATSLCVYKEWLPASWKIYPKENFDLQLLSNFIYACAIPVQDFRMTFFLLFPIFIISAYIQI